jgi:hypothetical protein
MEEPGRATIASRLYALMEQARALEENDPSYKRFGEFGNWRSEVSRWLKAGGPSTLDQWAEFESLQFSRVSQYDPDPSYMVWKRAFEITRYLVGAAIENLSQGWAPPKIPEVAISPSASMHSIVINNSNVQLNSLTVAAILEGIANEVDKVDSVEGKSFKDKLKRWAENPLLKTILEATIGAIVKSAS